MIIRWVESWIYIPLPPPYVWFLIILHINFIHSLLDGEGPVIVVIYMVQQINCIRNKEGEIIEGGEDQIRAKFYSIAFKQVYSEEDGLVQWTVVDYEFAGDIPYI